MIGLIIELSDNKLSDNKLTNNKLFDNNLASELAENRSFFFTIEEIVIFIIIMFIDDVVSLQVMSHPRDSPIIVNRTVNKIITRSRYSFNVKLRIILLTGIARNV